MAICNFCNKRETRSHPFTSPYVCYDCSQNDDNFTKGLDQDNNNITFVDATGKHVNINSDTELNVINAEVDTSNYKDSLLASLYSQVEFLRHELEEKNILIRTLIIRDKDHYNNCNIVDSQRNNTVNHRSKSDFSISYSQNNDGMECSSLNNSFKMVDEVNDSVNSFDSIDETIKNMEVSDARRKEKITRQLNDYRQIKHNIYLDGINATGKNTTTISIHSILVNRSQNQMIVVMIYL